MKWSNHAVRKQQLVPSSSASSVIADLKLLAASAIQTYCYVFAEGGKQQGNAIGRGGVGGLGGGGIGNEGAAGNVSQQSPVNLAADVDQCSMQTALSACNG